MTVSDSCIKNKICDLVLERVSFVTTLIFPEASNLLLFFKSCSNTVLSAISLNNYLIIASNSNYPQALTFRPGRFSACKHRRRRSRSSTPGNVNARKKWITNIPRLGVKLSNLYFLCMVTQIFTLSLSIPTVALQIAGYHGVPDEILWQLE